MNSISPLLFAEFLRALSHGIDALHSRFGIFRAGVGSRKTSLLTLVVLFAPLHLDAQLIQTNFSTDNGSAPGFAVSSADLLQTSLSSASSIGTFYESGANLAVLYNGVFTSGYGDTSNTVMPSPGTTITFAFNTATNPNGYSLTAIRSYASWGDDGRDGQAYAVSYSTVSAPTIFLSLGTVITFDASPADNEPSTMVQLTHSSGTLVTGVAQLRFTFNSVENNGTGYREFDVFGAASAIPEPSTYAALAGLAGLGFAAHRRRRRARPEPHR